MNKNIIKNIIILTLTSGLLTIGNKYKLQQEQLNKSTILFNEQRQQLQQHQRQISQLKFKLRMNEQKNKQILKSHHDLKNTLNNLKGKELISVGKFQITNYTLSPSECSWPSGHKNYGITASGKKATEGVSVAADWNILPKGTKIYIEGIGIREVQDTGNLVKGNVIDVFVGDPQVDRSSQSRAKAFGRQLRKVWVIHEAI